MGAKTGADIAEMVEPKVIERLIDTNSIHRQDRSHITRSYPEDCGINAMATGDYDPSVRAEYGLKPLAYEPPKQPKGTYPPARFKLVGDDGGCGA